MHQALVGAPTKEPKDAEGASAASIHLFLSFILTKTNSKQSLSLNNTL